MGFRPNSIKQRGKKHRNLAYPLGPTCSSYQGLPSHDHLGPKAAVHTDVAKEATWAHVALVSIHQGGPGLARASGPALQRNVE